jgi:3-phosphoglycerate kinase
MAIAYLKSAKIANKTVILRVDVNEPIGPNCKLDDDFRIQQIIPTIQYLLNQHCKIVIIGHLGRPEGKHDTSLSIRPVAQRAAELLGRKFIETEHALPDYPLGHVIFFTGDITNKKIRQQINEIPNKDIVFLENIRFYRGEENNSPFFAKQIAELGEVFVNDAFAVCHHPAASIAAITKYLPSYAGYVIERELKNLKFVLEKPKHPFVLMMGGMKISEKEKRPESAFALRR